MLSPRLPDGQVFFRPIRTDETQKELCLGTLSIILDWQPTF